MSWTIDTNFGNSCFSTDAISPFSTGGGNSVLSLSGTGFAYRSDLNYVDVELSCVININQHLGGSQGPSLIARRQTSDGSCYFGSIYFDNFSSGSRSATVSKYNGTLDTVTAICTSNTPEANVPDSTLPTLLMIFRFRVKGRNLLCSLFNYSTGNLIVETGAIHSDILSAGNPGIGANLYNHDSKTFTLADDLNIKEL
jgi:hypothetical protein